MDRFPVRGAVSGLALLLATCMAGCSGSSGATAPAPATEPTPVQADPIADPAPETPVAGEASVDFSAADSVVDSGDTVALSWTSQNVSECMAGGGWSGARDVQGSATVGPLDQSTTFTLTCTGDAGNAVAMLSVSVLGVVSLSWQAPSENEDGSPLTDLAGYRIYYGPGSRDYTDQVSVDGGSSTSRDVVLASGSYYFAMTALDVDGNESGYSNEVVRVVN